jgi:hypothetical protein
MTDARERREKHKAVKGFSLRVREGIAGCTGNANSLFGFATGI